MLSPRSAAEHGQAVRRAARVPRRHHHARPQPLLQPLPHVHDEEAVREPAQAPQCPLLPAGHLDTGEAPSRASNDGSRRLREDFTITEKAPTRAFSWLKTPTSAFTFKTLFRHYANP